jgi:coenzyme F420-reducing hydrogenase alpha subunit
MTTIKLEHISKIEGHASLYVNIDRNSLKKLELKINEGARFFESLLLGKKYDELPLITSRICGVCSPAHTLTAIKAIEDAFRITPDKKTGLLRELLAIGGLLQSHILHLYFLVLPDYLGYDSALQMAADRTHDIGTALKIKGVGNKIVTRIGGRDIHPVTTVVGGFSKRPTDEILSRLKKDLAAVRDPALETFNLFAGLPFPEFTYKTTFFALKDNRLLGNRICLLEKNSLKEFPHDTDIYLKKYFQHESTAEFVILEGKSYCVGARARLNVNKDSLPQRIKALLKFPLPTDSPFANIPLQALEVVLGVERALDIIDRLLESTDTGDPNTEVNSRSGTGIGVSEAPRGLLFHKYAFDKEGRCTKASVTTPTSQNLRMIEECLKIYVSRHLPLSKEKLVSGMEKLIRSFDPCISCSSH